MKKKIIVLFMCVISLFSMCFTVYGATYKYTVEEDYTEFPTLEQMKSMVYTYVHVPSSKYYWYRADDSYSARKLTTYLTYLEDDRCLVPNKSYVISENTSCGREICGAYVYDYNGGDLVVYDRDWYFRYWEDNGGELYYEDMTYFYLHTDDLTLCDCEYKEDGCLSEYNLPIANSQENALLWFQTGDISYLNNIGDFVDVPAPKNVSVYEASAENGIYIYWENDEGFENADTVTDGSKVTRMATQFYYRDSSDEIKIASNPINENVCYSKRNQYFISLDGVDDYDDSFVSCDFENWWIYGNIDVEGERTVVGSSSVNVTYDLTEKFVIISYYDKNGNIIDDTVIYIDDYLVKNDSYMDEVSGGGDSNGNSSDNGTNITPSINQNNYIFLDGIFNGFGLLGDNGLIAYMGQVFSYIPTPIITLLMSGVSAMVIVALFKLLVK